MSVNIFGSSGFDNRSSGVNKKYVNQKFATLSSNLATKVNKNGDLMIGDLNMETIKFVIFVILNKTTLLSIRFIWMLQFN